MITQPAGGINQVLVALSAHWHKLGMRSPSGRSAKNIAATALASTHAQCTAGVDGLRALRYFKSLLREHGQKALVARGVNVHACPETLKQRDPGAYARIRGRAACTVPGETSSGDLGRAADDAMSLFEGRVRGGWRLSPPEGRLEHGPWPAPAGGCQCSMRTP